MSSSQGKLYYCSITSEFGRVADDGTRQTKNKIPATWVDLDYGEAVAFQTLVLAPAVEEILSDSLKMGITKAVADGTMDEQVAQMLLATLEKEVSKPGKR